MYLRIVAKILKDIVILTHPMFLDNKVSMIDPYRSGVESIEVFVYSTNLFIRNSAAKRMFLLHVSTVHSMQGSEKIFVLFYTILYHKSQPSRTTSDVFPSLSGGTFRSLASVSNIFIAEI